VLQFVFRTAVIETYLQLVMISDHVDCLKKTIRHSLCWGQMYWWKERRIFTSGASCPRFKWLCVCPCKPYIMGTKCPQSPQRWQYL